MSRTELFMRGQAMTRRLHELQNNLNWSDDDLRRSLSILDETLPLTLHFQGTSLFPLSLSNHHYRTPAPLSIATMVCLVPLLEA